MVKIMEILIKIHDLGGFPPIFGNTHIDTPSERNSKSPWNYAIPQGKDNIPSIHFQVYTRC